MSDPQLLELTVAAFTADQLAIRVKNISGISLDNTLAIELSPPAYLVDDRINEAAKEAAVSIEPPGAQSLAGIVTGAEGWSVWARREATDTSVIIVLLNALNQDTGTALPAPVKFAAGAEFTIRIPLDPQAKRDSVQCTYSYLHGTDEKKDKRRDGTLDLKSGTSEWTPEVSLTTNQASPTAIDAESMVKIFWKIKDGVSATLRGPLPGGNSELSLSSEPNADFKISEGSIEVLVVASLTYSLIAEVKREGHPNVQVVRMLSLDTANDKFSYVNVRPDKVLPHGLVEIDWAAWGVKQVQIAVGTHTTRVINLTQQTLGRFYEGSGVMRLSASKPLSLGVSEEAVNLLGQPLRKKTSSITVITWEHMTKPDLTGQPVGLAVVGDRLAALTTDGLFIAVVGSVDPNPQLKKLIFKKVSNETPKQWLALTGVDQRFVVLRRTNQDDLEVAPYKKDGSVDEIPAITLPDLRSIGVTHGAVFDLISFGGRAYVVVEASVLGAGIVRRVYSISFNSNTKRAEYRPEPLLDRLAGYKLVTFDDGLYALHRGSGRVFRFDLTNEGRLGEPMQAASAVSKGLSLQAHSMIKQGLIVPVGRVLTVLSPSSVPSLAELEPFGLHNVLSYLGQTKQDSDPNTIPQDLVYNPQKNYWARCGHDIDVKPGAVAAFRGGGSPRLWVIQPDGETYTLAVGSESLFAHDYWLDFPTKPLPPYINKKRQFKIKSPSMGCLPMSETYRKASLLDFSSTRLAELVSPLLTRQSMEFDVEFRYNEADQAPVTVRYLKHKFTNERKDHDYIVELTFAGSDLSTITSVFRRIGIDAQGRLFNDEVFESATQHPADGPIEFTVPKQIDPRTSGFRLVIANSAKFDLKQIGLDFAPGYFSTGRGIGIGVDYKTPDASLIFDPKREPNGGEIRLNFNFAMPPGIEVSSGSTPQTKRVRLDPDKSKLLHVKFVGLLGPNEPPLRLPGISEPIAPMTDRVVYVCQIGDKP
ncbi:MAG TPA: hypothetical protein VE980_20485 [Pyrinomonadaceae bacterium]|nr:hypothetical protein [Pyrinomonadaceae bacterium]